MTTNITIKLTKNYFEKKAWEGCQLVCGLDEVGRGCLAGPVVVGAAIIPPNNSYHLLKDSKVLTADQRATAFAWINKNCIWTTSIGSNRMVDQHNIYQTTLILMKKAYQQLIEQLPHPFEKIKYVITDAMPFELGSTYSHATLEYYYFNKGERYSASIAAASIVAKVTRDRIMEALSPHFPHFAFATHKGYATQQHIQALQAQGPSPIHRISFLKNFEKTAPEKQKGLFEL